MLDFMMCIYNPSTHAEMELGTREFLKAYEPVSLAHTTANQQTLSQKVRRQGPTDI